MFYSESDNSSCEEDSEDEVERYWCYECNSVFVPRSDDDAGICPRCHEQGAPLMMIVFACTRCGRMYRNNRLNCSYCGGVGVLVPNGGQLQNSSGPDDEQESSGSDDEQESSESDDEQESSESDDESESTSGSSSSDSGSPTQQRRQRQRQTRPSTSGSQNQPSEAPPPLINSLTTVTITQTILDNGETECCICKDDFDIGSEVKMIECHHKFHHVCIARWLEEKSTCPLCRHEISPWGT